MHCLVDEKPQIDFPYSNCRLFQTVENVINSQRPLEARETLGRRSLERMLFLKGSVAMLGNVCWFYFMRLHLGVGEVRHGLKLYKRGKRYL